MKKILFAPLLTVLLITHLAQAEELFGAAGTPAPLPPDLREVGLEKLLNLDLIVTSPGRKEQALSDVASATFVISQEDIARSGATHVAELLRFVPGVNVARLSSGHWAVSARGFNQLFANKLLVLIDGVSVFSPTTNGVYWETIDLPLPDIERIEVVRGPGGSLWGSNAVNGVINIITKHASQTHGTLLSGGGGTHEEGFGLVRQGGRLGEDSDYRIFGKYSSRASNRTPEDKSALDDWSSGAMGFRLDSALESGRNISVQANASQQDENYQPLTPTLDPPYMDAEKFRDDGTWKSATALTQWQEQLSPDSDLSANLSFLYKERASRFVTFDYQVYTLEIQHHYRAGGIHDLVYGAGYRAFANSAEGSVGHEVDPSGRTTDLYTGFLQDEITVVPERFKLIVGSKFEHNDHTGMEIMPTIRGLYTPNRSTTFWTAASRAIASPAIFFEDTRIPVAGFPAPGAPLTAVAEIVGNPDLASERLLEYEIGARQDIDASLYLDLSAFYASHDNIFGQEAGDPFVANYADSGRPALIIPLIFGNTLEGQSYGVEAALNWKARSNWTLAASYTFFDVDISLAGGQDTANRDLIEGGSPQHQATFSSSVDLSNRWSLYSAVRYVDELGYGNINGYLDADVKLAW
ncbi:MAG: TonB-dependent receptor plug domain-containing protein [Oligoflexia bacterium]|nr:TonB-dependent receptor plug domain-containing protein [Oligoflexia bacterium]